MSINILTLCRGISNNILHYHKVPWIQLAKHCYIILQLTVSFSKTLRKYILTWNINEENNCLKYGPVCVVELLLHEEKCNYENRKLSEYESLKNMFFWAYMYSICFWFSASIKEQCPQSTCSNTNIWKTLHWLNLYKLYKRSVILKILTFFGQYQMCACAW